jgi:hypothetical protein
MSDKQIADLRRENDRLKELLPLEYRRGVWEHGYGDFFADAVITYSSDPSPDTGHVGWVWWVHWNVGEANSLREAKYMAQAALEKRDGRRYGR